MVFLAMSITRNYWNSSVTVSLNIVVSVVVLSKLKKIPSNLSEEILSFGLLVFQENRFTQ